MSVEKKTNGRYLARWRDPNGAQRARSFDRKLDADRFLATVTVDTLRGTYIDPSAGKETVSTYSARWATAQPWRASSRHRVDHVLGAQVVPVFGALELRQVRPSHVQAWIGAMSAGGLAASTVESYFRVLRR